MEGRTGEGYGLKSGKNKYASAHHFRTLVCLFITAREVMVMVRRFGLVSFRTFVVGTLGWDGVRW